MTPTDVFCRANGVMNRLLSPTELDSSVFGDRLVKVLVAGATGGCGRLVVRRLADLGIATRVLTRDARRAVSLGPVEVVEGNALSPEDCRRAIEG